MSTVRRLTPQGRFVLVTIFAALALGAVFLLLPTQFGFNWEALR